MRSRGEALLIDREALDEDGPRPARDTLACSSRHGSVPASPLPPRFADWFASRGWQPRAHQLALLDLARGGHSTLLVAPTGAGKTLAGFLPSLVGLSETRRKPSEHRLHTLYVSPLKALAVDIARNLEAPIAEMGLSIRVETRTGDTPSHKRTRQIARPPDILLTTPEQLSLLLAHREAAELLGGLRHVVLDELHALVTSKRGDLLSLALARLRRLSPGATAIGLSATVREPDELRRYLVGQGAAPNPPPFAGEGGPRSGSGEGSDISGEAVPLSRPSLTRGPPSPAEGGGKARPLCGSIR